MKVTPQQYVDIYLTNLTPYPRRFIFATSVEDFDQIVIELARRSNEKDKPNKWLDYRGKFRGVGVCASGNGICVLGARFDPADLLIPTKMTSLIGTMSHEIQHMLLHVCSHIGYNPMREHEPFTYLTKWVLERFVDFIRSYHGIVISAVPSGINPLMRDLCESGALKHVNGLQAGNIRDALARESRAVLNNTVTVTPFGTRSKTYFEGP